MDYCSLASNSYFTTIYPQRRNKVLFKESNFTISKASRNDGHGRIRQADMRSRHLQAATSCHPEKWPLTEVFCNNVAVSWSNGKLIFYKIDVRASGLLISKLYILPVQQASPNKMAETKTPRVVIGHTQGRVSCRK